MSAKRVRRERGRKRRGWLVTLAGALFILVVIGVSLFSTGLLGSQEASAELAPDLTLATLEGNFRLSQERGNVAVLYFSFVG
ncbi:MAG: hypothetical protein ACE5I2_03215 [Anaerolineae bacterium]